MPARENIFVIIELDFKLSEIDVFKSINAIWRSGKTACESNNKDRRKKTVFRENILYLVDIWEFRSLGIFVYEF